MEVKLTDRVAVLEKPWSSRRRRRTVWGAFLEAMDRPAAPEGMCVPSGETAIFGQAEAGPGVVEPGLPHRDRDAIVCDGAVRAGKTLCLGLSFFLWSMSRFRGQQFALCGKTTESVRRNLLASVLPVLGGLGFQWEEQRGRNRLTVRYGRAENTYFLFGGDGRGSAALIQGITLAGVLLDEAALMPRSFVEQACARCSVEGATLWFSCNPEGPGHWFYREWICKAEERNLLHLRFRMEDNPTLSPETRQRYERTFQGACYRRFILGEWTAADGLVYDFFDQGMVQPVPQGPARRWILSCDYGTGEPHLHGAVGEYGGVWYRVAEYYYDARQARRQQTDQEYARRLAELAGGRAIEAVVVDPSAASFFWRRCAGRGGTCARRTTRCSRASGARRMP